MALLHKATVTPTKLEILDAWLPGRPWFHGAAGVEKVASYRFDDPAGEVGLEAILVSSGDEVYQVPLTYRAAPLAGADGHLVGTMEHSVLGPRWAYDACADPVWASALATAIRTGGEQAEQHFDIDGRRRDRAAADDRARQWFCRRGRGCLHGHVSRRGRRHRDPR